MKVLFLVFFLFFVTGCDQERPTEAYITLKKETITEAESRFDVARVSQFKDDLSYGGWRGIYIVKDKKTNKEYLGVSGIGISELGSHTNGKAAATDER